MKLTKLPNSLVSKEVPINLNDLYEVKIKCAHVIEDKSEDGLPFDKKIYGTDNRSKALRRRVLCVGVKAEGSKTGNWNRKSSTKTRTAPPPKPRLPRTSISNQEREVLSTAHRESTEPSSNGLIP